MYNRNDKWTRDMEKGEVMIPIPVSAKTLAILDRLIDGKEVLTREDAVAALCYAAHFPLLDNGH